MGYAVALCMAPNVRQQRFAPVPLLHFGPMTGFTAAPAGVDTCRTTAKLAPRGEPGGPMDLRYLPETEDFHAKPSRFRARQVPEGFRIEQDTLARSTLDGKKGPD